MPNTRFTNAAIQDMKIIKNAIETTNKLNTRWQKLRDHINTLITSYQLAPIESVNGKKRDLLIKIRDHMEKLEKE